MNEKLRDLMFEAGYACPEMAGRALKLSELIIKECANIVREQSNREFGVREKYSLFTIANTIEGRFYGSSH